MRQFFPLAGLVLLLSACSKNDQEPLRKFISFQVEGEPILSENPTVLYTSPNLTDTDPANDYPTLTFTAIGNHQENITIRVVAPDTFRIGSSYSVSQEGTGMVITFPTIPQQLEADTKGGAFTFTLTKARDSLIEGSFSGKLIDTTGVITNKALTAGFVRAIIKQQK